MSCWIGATVWITNLLQPGVKERDVKQEQQGSTGRHDLVKPLSPRDCTSDRREGEDQVKCSVLSARQMAADSKLLCRTKGHGRKQSTEEPNSMLEIVVSQINDDVPVDVWENQGRNHIHANRLHHDNDENHEGPSDPHTQAEARPPRLNG